MTPSYEYLVCSHVHWDTAQIFEAQQRGHLDNGIHDLWAHQRNKTYGPTGKQSRHDTSRENVNICNTIKY